MQQLSFADWGSANAATRHEIDLHPAYHCAPQVFYFRPQQRWYLIYQAGQFAGRKGLTPVFSTAEKLGDATAWTKPQAMIENIPESQRWIDFWVICDESKAYLFYTADDGRFCRRDAKKSDFPRGWGPEVLVLRRSKEELFEASHTYRLKGTDRYVTLIEAMAPGRRYYTAYLADRLDGEWRPLAGDLKQPFAALENIPMLPDWTTSISHGELLRSGIDELLEVDPHHLRLLFQGVDDAGYRGAYGGIPWRLGLLEQR
jgi:hypothetical protein